MRFYQRQVLDFWREHPGEKAKLCRTGGLDAVGPDVDDRAATHVGRGSRIGRARWSSRLYIVALYVLAHRRASADCRARYLALDAAAARATAR